MKLKQEIESVAPAAVAGAARGSATPEEWWTHHAELLAVKMKLGGVQSFRIERNAKGNYEFEVTPTGWPNEKRSNPAVDNPKDTNETSVSK